MRMTAGASSLLVDVDRKSPGCVGCEDELGDSACGEAFFDVITMKMQDKRLIARPPQFHDIAFVDADEPHAIGNTATLDLHVEGELRRGDSGTAGGDQQKRRRPSCRIGAQHGASLAPYRPEFDLTSAMRLSIQPES